MINSEDKTLQALATSLNFRKLRQDVIASNIANAATPHYKARDIDFESEIKKYQNSGPIKITDEISLIFQGKL